MSAESKSDIKLIWVGIKNEETGLYETLYGRDPYLEYDDDGLVYDYNLFDICENL